MKVLYLWNTAGAFTPVADWLNDNGHSAKILMRHSHDPYDLTSCSDSAIMAGSVWSFYIRMVLLILFWRPDVLHVSGVDVLRYTKKFSRNIPIWFTYHGSEIRSYGAVHDIVRTADFVSVTTRDLTDYGIWIDRPISSDFRYVGGRVFGTTLMYYCKNFDENRIEIGRQYAMERGLLFALLNCDEITIPNNEMPALLSKYEYYLDFKGYKGKDAPFSKIALEALMCGCKVVHEDGIGGYEVTKGYDFVTCEEYFERYQELIMIESND